MIQLEMCQCDTDALVWGHFMRERDRTYRQGMKGDAICPQLKMAGHNYDMALSIIY